MPHTILVIDSEPTGLDLLCTVLKEKLGYSTVGVSDSKRAINYIESAEYPKPDLILFDVSAADVGFTGAIADLRVLTMHTPIITLVKYGDYSVATAALGSGAQDFLSKPIATERMRTTLSNALRLRDAQREISTIRHEQMGDIHSNDKSNGLSNATPAFSLVGDDGNIRRMEQIEAEAIRFAMQHYKGRMTEVARRLGIGRSTLYRKLSELMVRHQEAA